MSTRRALERAIGDVGELLEAHRGEVDPEAYAAYADDPVGFIEEVLGEELTEHQKRIALACRDNPLATVRSCHAAGKDWLAARLALWWVYARRGLVLLTGPTAAQVEEILMRGEIRDAFRGSGLPGNLHVKALRPGGSGKAGILAKTATGISSLTGFHDARVLFIITEAQDPEIDHAWDAAFACTTGENDRVLTLGNPTEPGSRFERAHRPGSDWRALKVAAEDIPNVAEGRTVVPGLLTREGVERFAAEYGRDSAFYISRVLGEFPEEAEDAAYRIEDLDRAEDLYRDGAFEAEEKHTRLVCAVDVAGTGMDPDRSCLCVRRGKIVEAFHTWKGLDTREIATRVRHVVAELCESTNGVKTVLVDTVGPGGPGVFDRLRDELRDVRYWYVRPGRPAREASPSVEEFKASRKAEDTDRYANLKAQTFHRLRRELQEGRLALPPTEGLREELLAHRLRHRADGRVEVGPKDAVRSRIGRSPDLADALTMTMRPMLESSQGFEIQFSGKIESRRMRRR